MQVDLKNEQYVARTLRWTLKSTPLQDTVKSVNLWSLRSCSNDQQSVEDDMSGLEVYCDIYKLHTGNASELSQQWQFLSLSVVS